MQRHFNLQAIKIRIAVVTIFVFFGAIFSACSYRNQDRNPDTLRVKIPVYDGTNYSSNVVELTTVKDLLHLSGLYSRFIYSPSIEKSELVGFEPVLRWMKTSDGVYIPTDLLSTELFSIFYHFERLSKFDIEIGTSELIKNWPRQQTVAVQVDLAGVDPVSKMDNVFYSGEFQSFLFLPYLSNELPLTVNGGVVGHEYFHALFHQLFLKKNEELIKGSEKNNYHEILFRCLNEGLADVWGWIYSNDEKFVSRSKGQFRNRDLSNSIGPIPSLNEFTGRISGLSVTNNVYYEIGSTYSQQIYRSFVRYLGLNKNVKDKDTRTKLAKSIMLSLVDMSEEFSTMDAGKKFDPRRPIEILNARIPELKLLD